MKKHTINVQFQHKSYPIYIGNHLLSDKELIKSHLAGRQVMIVTNQTIEKLYLSTIEFALKGIECHHIILPDGEQFKTAEQFLTIMDQLIEHHHNRDTTIIALGGGVIGDIAGFSAACYQRGVAFIQMPTSLLAQVDASIGGKTAINHPKGKNLIGAFHQPEAVIIDVNTLTTLPDREFKAGIAEIIKAALIKDKPFFEKLEQNMPQLLQKNSDILITTIQRSCEIKRDLIAADEKDTTGTRALLNLGHTFGHAIEQMMGYGEWLHGEAVATGIMLATKLSQQKGWIDKELVQRIEKLFRSIPLPVHLPNRIDHDTLWTAIQMDKKILGKQLHLVLLKDIGHAVLTSEITETEIKNLVKHQ